METLRRLVEPLVPLVSRAMSAGRVRRSPAHQARVERELEGYALYHFAACPYCRKVRRCMNRLDLPIELRDALFSSPHRRELVQQGGQLQVPCLRIDHGDGSSRWMYESDDIVAYLTRRFPLED